MAKAKKERATLAEKTGGGASALVALAQSAPAMPTAAERLAAARVKREQEVLKAITPDVVKAVKALRAKGYGWGVVANTVADALDLKIGASILKQAIEFIEKEAQQSKPAVSVGQAKPATPGQGQKTL